MAWCQNKERDNALKKIILMVQGSLRKQSFNRQLQAAIIQALGDAVEVKELDFGDVPFMNQDIEWPTPASIQRVRNEFAAADGIWIVTPQYNASYPANIKNLIDWMSRPSAQGSSKKATKDKKVTFSGIGGRTATLEMRTRLGELLPFVGMNSMDELGQGYTVNGSAWGDNVVVFTDEQKAAIQAQADAFLKFIEA